MWVQCRSIACPGAVLCCADALRYLPGHVTISSIAGTFWNTERDSVETGFHTVPQPDSPAVHPRFHHHHTIGASADVVDFDATTTLLLEVRYLRYSLKSCNC